MATAKPQKAITVALPECPVCLDALTVPIFQCQMGHSLCNSCTNTLKPPICPLCRQAMTKMRNWQLEEMVHKAKVQCPNKSFGCVYTMSNAEIECHLKECIFRDMVCPHGAVFGKCSWRGKLKEMMGHFKERHPQQCGMKPDVEIVLKNIRINNDDRHLFLVSHNKMLFIITFKLDTLQKMAYWTVQHIGTKTAAQQYYYVIAVSNKQDEVRNVLFTERCFNDAITADELFRRGRCAVLPLDYLSQFIKDKKLTFLYVIKKGSLMSNDKQEKGSKKNDNKPANHNSKNPGAGSKSPGPKSVRPEPIISLGYIIG